MLLTRYACRKVSRLLWDYAAYRLPESDWESVERHLQVCARCRREMEPYRRAVRLVEATRCRPAPESETTWHALRAQLEGAAVAHPGRIVVRARSRRVAGMALAGALIPAAIAAIVLLPARNPRSTTIVSNPAPADHPLAVADRFLAVISDALARPAQVEEIAVHPAASASASHPARPNSTGFRPEYVRTMHSDSNSYWPGRALRQRADRIQQLHRQAPQDTSSHLKLASAAQVDRPQEASSALYSALDPLPAPSEQPRQYIIDMVNLSPSTPTLASNPQDSKDQTIW